MMLKGKRIIVTGGAQGIGASVVRAYVSEGAQVASLDVKDDLGEQVAAEAAQKGPGSVSYYHCDISIRSEVEAKVEEAVHKLGRLDVLANIAGVYQHITAEATTEQDLDRIFKINFYGTVYTNQAAFKHMRENGGRIINFGSGAGMSEKCDNSAHYSASKGAVHSWTRVVAKEWGKYGITANAVAPAMWTPMCDAAVAEESPEGIEAMHAWFKSVIPLGGRMGDPDRDLAPVMVFLASDAARFITAQIIPVDGGMVSTR